MGELFAAALAEHTATCKMVMELYEFHCLCADDTAESFTSFG